MDIFERASRAKLRFSTTKGQLTAEDLWDLNLTSLDTLAKQANKRYKEEEEESFVTPKVKKASENQLQLDILKHVIASKLATEEASKKRAETNAKVARIEEIILKKQDETLSSKSVDELKAELEQLKA